MSQLTEKTELSYADVPARVKRKVRRGAKLLDRNEPNWFKPHRVSMKALDLSHCELCVAGQVFARRERSGRRSWRAGYHWLEDHLRELAPRAKDPDPSEFGFTINYGDGTTDWLILELAWEHEIRTRRQAARTAG